MKMFGRRRGNGSEGTVTGRYMIKAGIIGATGYAGGELAECDEARPFWIRRDEIPFDNMWADDRLWLPVALEGRKFEANFIFHDREMISSDVRVLEEEADEEAEDDQ